MSAFERPTDDWDDPRDIIQPCVIDEFESIVVSKYFVRLAIQVTPASDGVPRGREYVVGDTYGALSADVLEKPELAT
ncbi:hypothetical protein [Natrinema soli]|uniref:Uncharacterized protein n=1 Tax=Natrinema soli TaxID=1930624 RepID=A0ABD5SGM0_9EURY